VKCLVRGETDDILIEDNNYIVSMIDMAKVAKCTNEDLGRVFRLLLSRIQETGKAVLVAKLTSGEGKSNDKKD